MRYYKDVLKIFECCVIGYLSKHVENLLISILVKLVSI